MVVVVLAMAALKMTMVAVVVTLLVPVMAALARGCRCLSHIYRVDSFGFTAPCTPAPNGLSRLTTFPTGQRQREMIYYSVKHPKFTKVNLYHLKSIIIILKLVYPFIMYYYGQRLT